MGIKNTSVLLLAVLAFASCTEKNKNNLSIDGTLVNSPAEKVYLQKFNNKMYDTIDSAVVIDGKFSFSKQVEIPEIYGLTVDPSESSYLLFLDGNPITVQLDSSRGYSNTQVTGSALQDRFLAYKKQSNVKIDEFIKEDPSSLVSAYVLYRDFSYRLSPEEIKANVALLDTSLLKTPYVQVLEDLAGKLEKLAIGNQAPDFSSKDPQGNTVSLYEHLGKSYVLLDFWASWCGPCRRENPNIVAAYQAYKDKGFDIFAVSLDKNKAAWEKAIESDQLTWTHVSDLRHWDSEAASLYGVRAIPANYLLDAEGKVVGKNLRGEDLLNTLKDLYGKK